LKKKKFLFYLDNPAIFNSRKSIDNYNLKKIAKLLTSLEETKTNLKSLGSHDKAY